MSRSEEELTSKKNEHAGLFIVLGFALALPFAAWFGFVISTLWRWFAVPLGVIHIGVWEAAGLFVLVRILTFDSTLNRDEEKSALERFVAGVVLGLIVPATALAFGAIYHGFA